MRIHDLSQNSHISVSELSYVAYIKIWPPSYFEPPDRGEWKICNLAHIYGRIAKIRASYRKSGSANTMVTSDFWPEVEL